MKNKQISIPTKGDIENNDNLDVFKELEILAAFKQTSLNQYIVDILIEHAKGLRMLQYKGVIIESGYCPNCYLRKGTVVKTFATPIKNAHKNGFVEVNDSSLKYLEKTGTHFVICPDCHWWGWPKKNELDKLDKLIEKGYL